MKKEVHALCFQKIKDYYERTQYKLPGAFRRPNTYIMLGHNTYKHTHTSHT